MHSDYLYSTNAAPPRATPKRVRFNGLRYKLQRVKNGGESVYINGETFTADDFAFMLGCFQPPKE